MEAAFVPPGQMGVAADGISDRVLYTEGVCVNGVRILYL